MFSIRRSLSFPRSNSILVAFALDVVHLTISHSFSFHFRTSLATVYVAARPVAAVQYPGSFLSPFLGSHSLLVAYLFYPYHLHINTPASGFVEARLPVSPFPFLCARSFRLLFFLFFLWQRLPDSVTLDIVRALVLADPRTRPRILFLTYPSNLISEFARRLFT